MDGECLSAAVFGGGGHEPLVLELLELGVDGARAGAVCAAGALFQILHQLLTVLGPLLQQREQRESDLPSLEETALPGPGSAVPAAAVAASLMVPAIHDELLGADIEFSRYRNLTIDRDI